MSLKQIIIVRKDLKMSSGKVAAQSSHASTEAVLKTDSSKVKEWRGKGMKKVILKVSSQKEILDLKLKAEREGLVTSLIKDAGKTQVTPGTITCLGIGPDSEEKIDKLAAKLKLL